VIATATTRNPRPRFARRLRVSVLGGMVAAIAVAGTAGAYWGTIGTGSGTAPVATLAGPTLTGSAGAGTATLTWTVVAPLGSGTVSYFVKRNGGAPAGDCPTQAARAPS